MISQTSENTNGADSLGGQTYIPCEDELEDEKAIEEELPFLGYLEEKVTESVYEGIPLEAVKELSPWFAYPIGFTLYVFCFFCFIVLLVSTYTDETTSTFLSLENEANSLLGFGNG